MEIGNLAHDKFHPKEGSLVIDAKNINTRYKMNKRLNW